MNPPENALAGFDPARNQLIKSFNALKQGKTLPQVNLIERIQAKALETLDSSKKMVEMSFALVEEAASDKLEWHYQRGYRLGSENKNPASLTAPHLAGFFDAQNGEPAIC